MTEASGGPPVLSAEMRASLLSRIVLPAGCPVVQCAANFSEGRDEDVIRAIAGAARTAEGAVVADVSADPDHHRMVLSLLGHPEAVAAAIVKAVRSAAAHFDLRRHQGAHPRMGVADVVPFTPVRGVAMEQCVALARSVGAQLADMGIPVYFYERSALVGRPSSLPHIRRAVGAVRGGELCFERLTPDLGGAPSDRLGAAVVGARMPLVAYNIYLASGGRAEARAAAARVRADRQTHGEIAGVRAMGLYLPSRGTAQVSMNVTMPDRTPLPGIYAYLSGVLEQLEAAAGESEVVGLLNQAALGGPSLSELHLESLLPTQVIEYWTET